MKLKNKNFSRLLCVILTFVMMCTSAIPVSAATADDYLIPVEVNSLSDEYVILTDANSASTYATTAAYGPDRHYLGHFSFYDYNIGSYRTINGSRMRVCIAWKPTDGLDEDYPISASLYLKVYQYNHNLVQETRMYQFQDEADADGYHYFVLPWIDIVSGVDYNMEYYAFSDGSGEPRTMDCHVWLDIE